jgi:hypothetical protein
MPMVPRFEVSEGADGLLRVGSGAHTHLKLSRDDARWLVEVLAQRLEMPPPKLQRLSLWQRFREWLGRRAKVKSQLDRDAMYERLGKRLAERYGARE